MTNEYQLKSKFKSGGESLPLLNAEENAGTVKKAPGKIRPRILMVGMHLTKTRGGISTLIAEILSSSLKNDFEFVYIASQAEDFGRFGKLFLALGALAQFIFQCLTNKFSVVYIHLGSNASLYRESVFIVLAKLLGQKTAVHFHAGDIDEYLPLQSKIGQNFIRRAIVSAETVIAVSRESAEKLQRIAPDAKISVIPNAVETTAFAFPARIVRPNEPVRLLFVGAVGKLKGELDLLAALATVRPQNLHIKISLLGYGAEQLRGVCEKLEIAEYIEFLGAVSLEERLEFFKRADIFVLPTYAEAMPMSVIEAMAAGLPVITTRVGGIPELIDDGVEGFLIKSGDVSELARKISLLVDSPLMRVEMGVRARRRAVTQMDFRLYSERLGAHLGGL